MPLLSSNPTKLSLGGSFVNSGSLINAGSLINSGSLGIGSLNKISASSFNGRTQDPHKIDFSEGWGKGPTEKWYAQQQGHTTFRKLQYRKEREAPFNHEFIVVELDNNTVCRFDRRGDVNNRANVLMGEPIPSEDTAHIIAKSDDEFYPIIDANSDLLLSIQFPQGQDLRTILAVCFGIHSNKATQSYSLTRYNCYFFSWMIITATARFTVDWTQLASEENLWQALIASAVKSFGRDQGDSGPLAQPKATVATASGPKNQVTQFIGSAYLCTTLQIALGETREKIRTSLAELILHSTVDRAMEDVSKTSAQKAASKAARSHAAQAARDAAMEAVIETMWRDIISYEGTDGTDGGDIWAKACELAEKCVEKASSAAADSAGATNRTIVTPPATPSSESTPLPPTSTEGTEVPAPPAKWETAWNMAWEECWSENGQQQSGTAESSGADSSKTSVSDRAKAAWNKAWQEALKANEQYVPLVSRGVADYVTRNLPDGLPEVLHYETNTDENMLKKMVKALNPTNGSSNHKLQEWVKNRIVEHCQQVLRMTAGAQRPSNLEFEETMRSIWTSTVRCLLAASSSEGTPPEDDIAADPADPADTVTTTN